MVRAFRPKCRFDTFVRRRQDRALSRDTFRQQHSPGKISAMSVGRSWAHTAQQRNTAVGRNHASLVCLPYVVLAGCNPEYVWPWLECCGEFQGTVIGSTVSQTYSQQAGPFEGRSGQCVSMPNPPRYAVMLMRWELTAACSIQKCYLVLHQD